MSGIEYKAVIMGPLSLALSLLFEQIYTAANL